jgi:secreted trypsin-like serine protease
MFNIKSTAWLASIALLFALAAPVAKAAGMPPTGNFVSLRVSGSHLVYGVILSPTKILVPAHSVGGAVASYTILAGSPDRTNTTCATCQMRAVLSVVRHPSYNNNGTYGNDLAVVRIPALTFNANVYGSTLAPNFSNAVGTQFTQIGYGTGGVNHNRLQTTATSPWTLTTMAGYVYTPGDFVTATNDTTINGMISHYVAPNLQVYTKLSDYAAWIDAN